MNLYCTGTNQAIPNCWIVGTCTDPTFEDPVCPLPFELLSSSSAAGQPLLKAFQNLVDAILSIIL